MRKIGRNEPCPCGSGLKYKRCCLKKNIIPLSSTQIDEQLMALSTEMIEFGLTQYKTSINESLMKYGNKYKIDGKKEDRDHFIALSLPWIILHEPIAQEKTLYEIFAEEKLESIQHDGLKHAFEQWGQAPSSFFEIISIIDQEKSYIEIRNVMNNELHTIKLNGVTDENIGNFIVGTLLQANEADHFLYASIGLPVETKNWLDVLIHDLQVSEEKMTESFIGYVAECIQAPTEKVEWEEAIYEKVASAFVERMEKQNIENEMIAKVISFWHYYSSKHKPIIRKEAGYIASLEYLLHHYFLDGDQVTQKALADQYGVSTTTISGHYHKFIAEMDQLNEEDN